MYLSWEWHQAVSLKIHPVWDSYASHNAAPTYNGHATLLVVDTKNKTYTFFDPNGGVNSLDDQHRNRRWFDRYALMGDSNNILIPGYVPIIQRQTGMVIQNTLERLFEGPRNRNETPMGLCAVAVSLIMTFCRRFNYAMPAIMADHISNVIVRNIQTQGDYEIFARNLVHWFARIYKPGRFLKGACHHTSRWQKMLSHLGADCFVNDKTVCVSLVEAEDEPNRKCMVFSERNGMPCRRAPCNGLTLCWQHRHMMINRWNANRKKCSDAIEYNRFGPLPPRLPGHNPGAHIVV